MRQSVKKKGTSFRVKDVLMRKETEGVVTHRSEMRQSVKKKETSCRGKDGLMRK
jgi:hypothetical protein